MLKQTSDYASIINMEIIKIIQKYQSVSDDSLGSEIRWYSHSALNADAEFLDFYFICIQVPCLNKSGQALSKTYECAKIILPRCSVLNHLLFLAISFTFNLREKKVERLSSTIKHQYYYY